MNKGFIAKLKQHCFHCYVDLSFSLVCKVIESHPLDIYQFLIGCVGAPDWVYEKIAVLAHIGGKLAQKIGLLPKDDLE